MNNEALYQFGQFGSGDIHAFWIAADNGYTFKNLRFQPRLGLRAGIASGDKDPNNPDLETLNPLFVRGNYFSEAGLLAPQNLMGFGPSIRIKPDRALSAELGCVTLWRESLGDSIYRPPGIPIFQCGQRAWTLRRHRINPGYGLAGDSPHRCRSGLLSFFCRRFHSSE